MSDLHDKVNNIDNKVTALMVHVDYIKTHMDDLKKGYSSVNKFKNMTYGICAFLIVVLPLILAVK